MFNSITFAYRSFGVLTILILFYVFWLEYKVYDKIIHDVLDIFEVLITNIYSLETKNKIEVFCNDNIPSKQNDVEKLFDDPLNYFMIETLTGVKIREDNKQILKTIIFDQMINVQQNNLNYIN